MKIGDTVEVLGQLSLTQDREGVIETMEYGRVKVRFPDGWRRFYSPGELREVEVCESAEGSARIEGETKQ